MTRKADKRALVLEAIGSGLSRMGAAADAGVARSTMYRWIDESPAFRRKLEEAEGRFERRVVNRMTAASNRGSWGAMAWLAERRLPDRFRAKQEIELSGSLGLDDADVRLARELREMPAEELAAEHRADVLAGLRELLVAGDADALAMLDEAGFERVREPAPRFGRAAAVGMGADAS